jgi:hypothetical protein
MAVDGYFLSRLSEYETPSSMGRLKSKLYCQQWEPITLSETPRGLKHALASVACNDRWYLTVYVIFSEGGYLGP